MDSKKVLVTGIGGNVGQGIIRNIRNMDFPIRIIGTNISDFSSGNHLCDIFYKTPFAYEPDYITRIKEIVEYEKIDLIIPSTDYEGYYLALENKKIPCTIAVSPVSTMEIYLDKYQTYLQHKKNNLPFAESFLPSTYKPSGESIILKPRKGRGSRGIFINPPSLSEFTDDEYMVQKLYTGKEITTAFYITKQKEIHGHITMYRTLENGTTNFCKVTHEFDNFFEDIIPKIIKNIEINGSANIQSIVTENGEIFPFEINCRISGTNSIRSHFGFEDVAYTIEEYLYNTVPAKCNITNGIATRILMDVIYPNQDDENVLKSNLNNFKLF